MAGTLPNPEEANHFSPPLQGRWARWQRPLLLLYMASVLVTLGIGVVLAPLLEPVAPILNPATHAPVEGPVETLLWVIAVASLLSAVMPLRRVLQLPRHQRHRGSDSNWVFQLAALAACAIMLNAFHLDAVQAGLATAWRAIDPAALPADEADHATARSIVYLIGALAFGTGGILHAMLALRDYRAR